MTQNFDPVKLAADVANLCREVEDLKAIITGKADFNFGALKEVMEAAEAAARVAGNFLPEVDRIDALVRPLMPLIPLVGAIQADYAGEVAGVGGTLEAGQVIPSSELGTHSNEPINPVHVADASKAEEQPQGNA